MSVTQRLFSCFSVIIRPVKRVHAIAYQRINSLVLHFSANAMSDKPTDFRQIHLFTLAWGVNCVHLPNSLHKHIIVFQMSGL